jgi:hypothetical protein
MKQDFVSFMVNLSSGTMTFREAVARSTRIQLKILVPAAMEIALMLK